MAKTTGNTIADPRRFIVENTGIRAVPLVPEISLHVADEAVALWQKTEEDLGRIGLPPPFWAFAWAGGQALARYVLDHPDIVRGRRVLDFASGSGLVAIAAAMAGAAAVEAADIDAFAVTAIGLNADLNGVRITARADDLVGEAPSHDIVLAGDICYERDTAARVTLWLEQLAAAGVTVLIGDPGRSYLPHTRLEGLATYVVPVTRALEDAEIKHTGVWRFKPAA